jgi:hypothetical protein
MTVVIHREQLDRQALGSTRLGDEVRIESIETESQRDDLDIVRPLDHETSI